MRLVAVACIALLIGVFAGAWYASRERTCAVVPSSQGNVVLCSNSWKAKVEQ